MPQPIQVDPFERLRELLLPEEAASLVEHLVATVGFNNGFGRVEIDLEHRRVKEIAHRSTSRPGIKTEMS